MFTDGHTSITVSIDYSADANAAAKWRLAGGAHSKALLFRAAGKRKGRSGDMTHDWWPVDRFRGMFRFMTGPSLWRLATDATRPLINLLSAPPNGWGTAVVGVNEGTAGRILMPSATALLFFVPVMGHCASSQRDVVSHEGAHERWLSCLSTTDELSLI